MPSSRKKPVETPVESFERLRQAFDSIKENHTDPWCWHPYLSDDPKKLNEPEDPPDDDDPEGQYLAPKARTNCDRLKSHLLTCVSELHRAAQAADMCYYHMSTEPDQMRECCIILGTSGEVDEEMLASGDASPQKIMAMLQEKLRLCREEIAELKQIILNLKERLADTEAMRNIYWRKWQNSQVLAEESMTRLDSLWQSFNDEMQIKADNEKAYSRLTNKWIRCDRLMKYQGREVMRVTFKANNKENMFYAFVGFIHVLSEQKAERERREMEARRDAVEFSLRNEVRFLIEEIDRRQGSVEMFANKIARLTNDRRTLAMRVLYRMRPYERLEYCLWVWEMWRATSFSGAIRLEKQLHFETAAHNAVAQQLRQASAQVLPMAKRMDILKRQMVEEKANADILKREVTLEYCQIIATMWEKLYQHRMDETHTLTTLKRLEIETKDERIAVLERDIAEDKHIQSLKGMVVDLESRLRKALDRRKPKGLVVPPMKGMKCVMCSREIMHRNWKTMPKAPEFKAEFTPRIEKSQSEAELSAEAKAWRVRLDAKQGKLGSEDPASPAVFSAVWRS